VKYFFCVTGQLRTSVVPAAQLSVGPRSATAYH